MLQMKRPWTSTPTEMSLWNPHLPTSNLKPQSQLKNNQPNVKQSSNWMTTHLRILWGQRRSHKNWLALRRHTEMHGSCRQKVPAETALGSWPSLHNWLSKMRNGRIWLPSKLQQWSPTIMRMASMIQCLTMQQPSLGSPTNGIQWWKKS